MSSLPRKMKMVNTLGWTFCPLSTHTWYSKLECSYLTPLCPMAKGKKVLFVFILEILDGNRTQSGSFWEVLKKHYHHDPIKPKKPKVTLGTAPVAPKKPKVSLIAAYVAEAILKKPDQVEKDAMTGVEPSVSADPPPSHFYSHSLLLASAFSKRVFLKVHPFPHEFDHVKIKKWLSEVKKLAIAFTDIGTLVREAGHTDPDCLQHIQVLVSATGLLPPPSFSPSLPHSLVREEMVPRLLPFPP